MFRPVIKKRAHKNKKVWYPVAAQYSEKQYREQAANLEKAGIDYRVWMDANDPDLAYIRKQLGENENNRIRYIFYVKKENYYRASWVMGIDYSVFCVFAIS